ncbi:hydroxyacylglutathione hydrolase [Pseudomonas flavescens]|uniref:Hydroxyacylglutathione hydrolase n=1 Tax=Phytopseudomonas flavescens TaxID=29435 RepID=A0A1G8IZJ6_9GAMM|nr:hydroxyacylglutathione hydrolase [Pseudomonas flavescens]SDI24286.1 hydroxyacylglutathione hydrolase [Pseudomonas flavescens]
MIKIEALSAFSDNYIWLLQDERHKRVAVVDPGDAAPVQAWLQAHPGWTLSDILVTHHHPDHVGGVESLRRDSGARVYGPAKENIPARDQALADGDRIDVLGLTLQVIEVPGHTLGHIAFYQGEHHWLFSGDTLFAAGCGRLFEGTPVQMHQSLQRLAALPDSTLIYCGHEYTLSNLRFAQAVEPGNQAIAERLQQVAAWREQGRISLPSRLDLERATNPFLRGAETSVKQMIASREGRAIDTEGEVFAVLRAWKDRF